MILFHTSDSHKKHTLLLLLLLLLLLYYCYVNIHFLLSLIKSISTKQKYITTVRIPKLL